MVNSVSRPRKIYTDVPMPQVRTHTSELVKMMDQMKVGDMIYATDKEAAALRAIAYRRGYKIATRAFKDKRQMEKGAKTKFTRMVWRTM